MNEQGQDKRHPLTRPPMTADEVAAQKERQKRKLQIGAPLPRPRQAWPPGWPSPGYRVVLQ
jgi:hypothetical protein